MKKELTMTTKMRIKNIIVVTTLLILFVGTMLLAFALSN